MSLVRATVGLGLGLIAASCSSEAPVESPLAAMVVVTQVPSPASGRGLEPAERYPLGSRLVRQDLHGSGASGTVLTDGMVAAGGASPDHDASRIVFVGKDREADPYRIWICDPEGGGRTRAVATETDCGSAAFLPDGRVVYSAALPSAIPPPVPGMRRGWALFVAEGDGTQGTRITFAAGCALDPYVLADGRIAHSTWVADDSTRGGHFELFAVHPDGTGATALCVLDGVTGDVSRPRQRAGGDLYCVVRSADGAGRLHVWDWRAPSEPGKALFADAGIDVAGAEPLPDGGVLVVAADGSGPSVLRDSGAAGDGGSGPPDGFRVTHAVSLAPRPRPQGHLSMVKPDLRSGTLLAIDARPPGATTATKARLLAVEGHFVPGARPVTRILGTIPLEADGSFFARVPADTPLLLDLLDDQGNAIHEARAPFWVRPNENRACVGCHEPLDTAPPNRRPLAVLADPVDLTIPSPRGERR